jgi:hypothetical protein
MGTRRPLAFYRDTLGSKRWCRLPISRLAVRLNATLHIGSM